MSPLKEKIRESMEREGPWSLERFMEAALYAPRDGYYRKTDRMVGREGDFFTSVSVGSLFGALLGAQLLEWSRPLNADPLVWIETGAHDGQLAKDILDFVAAVSPGRLANLRYIILEPWEERQRVQERRLLEDFGGQVQWFCCLEELGPESITGILFSNELLDAFPARRAVWDAGHAQWMEGGVCWAGKGFQWCRLPTDPSWIREFSGLDDVSSLENWLPEGFCIDLSPAASIWWKKAGSVLSKGWLVALDYGGLAEDLWRPERSHGTLRAFQNHRHAADPLQKVGEQDLTVDVNFSSIIHAGEAVGLTTVDYSEQSRFLSRIAMNLLQAWKPMDLWSPSWKNQFRTLTHPNMMGSLFKALVQKKGIPAGS